MRMDNHRPNLIIISISIMYWLRVSVDCWKFDLHNAATVSGGGGGGISSSNSASVSEMSNENNDNVRNSNDGVNGVADSGISNSVKNKGNNNQNNNSNNNSNKHNNNNGITMITKQDILYSCPLNSMCQCAGLPNETSTLIEINCNDVPLYKFPEFLHSSVRYIELSKTKLQSVDDETFQGLRLETLKLIDNKLMEISERSFYSMSHSLMTLDISGNLLQQLPLDAFRNLHVLTRLVAQRNQITTLDGNWGSLSDTLRSLHLSSNKIYEITSGQHDDNSAMTLLSKMNLTSSSSFASSVNSLLQHQLYSPTSNHLTLRPFSKLRKLVWLDLSGNRISHISNSGLPRSLVTVDLSRNLLQIFPQQLFEHLYDLRILSLKDNLIRTISCKELRLMRIHLDKLDLSSNQIEEIRSDWFQNNYSDVHIRALNLEKNFIRSIPSNAFRGTGIQHLVLAFNEISRIHIDAFAGIQDTLEYLDLERNELHGVPGAIKTLNKLKYLYLTSNRIAHLSNLPQITHNLRVLSLSGNNFTSIPSEGLKNYTELSYLNMGYNSIAEIPDNIFVGWGKQLQTILLRNNKITALQYGSFNGLDSIKEISLSFNDIVYTNPFVFENVSKTLKILELSFAMYRDEFPMEALSSLNELMWLGLDNNNLKLLLNESLITMCELSYINLGFNQISNIPRDLFHPEMHRHLVEVDLSYNLIERIVTRTFDSLSELQTINLQSNKIRTIERHAFHNLNFLTYIDLSYNKLKNISISAFSYLPRLINLDLMHNSLCSVSLRMFNFVSNSSLPLKLNMSYNRISNFDDDLNSYLYIYHLDISRNLISNSLSFSNLGNTLKILDLMYNSLTMLGNHAFGDLEFLEILNLSHNNITSLRRRSFQGLNSLQDLDLSYNRLEQLQVEQFSNLKKLRILRIRNNRLRALPREVFMNTRLEYLDISNNFLTVWPVSSFSDVGFTLRNIQFVNNQLEYLDSNMFINSQFLIDINLSRNKITVLPDNTFTFLNNLTNLDLSYNPLVTSNLREVFIHTPRVKILNLRGMGLYILPNLNLPFLTELDISNNYLQELYSFHDMRLLRILNVSSNKIVNVSNVVEHLPMSVRVLDLSYNPIRRASIHDMSFLKYIDELSLLDVKIPNPNVFSKLRYIRKLRMTTIHNLGDIISRMPSLQELYIHVLENTIRDDLLSKLINNTKLNLIEIYGRNVHTISHDAFVGLSRNHKLKIRLHTTRISDLPPSIFYPLRMVPHLQIDISDNRLATLAADSFYPNITFWDTVGTRNIIGGLDTANNPLECECGLVWFGHWLRRWLRESAQINLIQKDELKRMVLRARTNTCHDPTTGRNLYILAIFPEDLLCHASALSSSAVYSKHIKFLLFYIIIFLPIIIIMTKTTLLVNLSCNFIL